MNSFFYYLAFSLFSLSVLMSCEDSEPKSIIEKHQEKGKEKSPAPYNYWLEQRSYPSGFDVNQYMEKLTELKSIQTKSYAKQTADSNLTLDWKQEGPGNIGGRFNVLTMSSVNQDVMYAGAANGGIFKTTDAGDNWNPIFDQYAYLSIGSISLNPQNENTIYVGTGDRNFGGNSHIGYGVYKSQDGGSTWAHSGLEETGIVTELIIHPTDSQIIFVSTLGNTYEKTTERGIYKSEDGGVNWTNILFVSDSSGAIDMMMDPTNPEILYCSFFNRINLPFNGKIAGHDANIYKTTDGGANWTELTNGLPSDEEHSRIGLAMSMQNPNTLYATYTHPTDKDISEIYKSTNAGLAWTGMNVHDNGLPENVQGNFGWYFGEIYVNPFDDQHLMIPGVEMYSSINGGASWYKNVPNWWTYEVHADKHAALFLDATSYIIATDGGLYKTENHGEDWEDFENIPVTQFYHIAVDPNNAGDYGGGAQDNGTAVGNADDFNNWSRIYGGDGFRLTYIEDYDGVMYLETQRGGLVYNDFGDIYDLEPELEEPDRVNWDMPYYVNPNTEELFIGTSQVFLMEDAPYSGIYESISSDLTRVGTGNYIGNIGSHTITEIDQSEANPNTIFVGTNDGLVWRGDRTNSQWSWENLTTSNLPNQIVTMLRVSPDTPSTVYLGFSGYRQNDGNTYLFRSTDSGENWESISSNLPEMVVNDLLILPNSVDSQLFVALDGGVFYSDDAGTSWEAMGENLPFLTISELDVDYENEKLIAGTYSRSMWSYDISWAIDSLENPNIGIEEPEDSHFVAYPNPVINQLNINGKGLRHLSIYNTQGQLVFDHDAMPENPKHKFNLSHLNPGIYIYKTNLGEGKLVKE